ncbi:MAG: hypothetical protein ABI155_06750 [Paralcaligenes sp.]
MVSEERGQLPAEVSLVDTSAGSVSGVCWAAIFAGAAAAAALSLILLILGTGLGFSALSPWASGGLEAKTVGISAAVWLALTQIVASGLGGYIAGRLRVIWAGVHTDEVYFRDTAHGMLSWAVATLVTAAFLGSALTGLLSSGASATGSVTSSVLTAAQHAGSGMAKGGDGDSLNYFVEALFRSDQAPTQGQSVERTQGEATAILLRSITTGQMDAGDKTYLAKLIGQRTGLSEAEAQKRIDTLYAQVQKSIEDAKVKAKQAIDAARKAAAAAALWTFVALLCGAFFASLAAIWGGRRRDLALLRL